MILMIDYSPEEIPLKTEALQIIEAFINDGEPQPYTYWARKGKFKVTKDRSALVDECYTIERIK